MHEELRHIAVNPQAPFNEELRHVGINPLIALHEELHVAAKLRAPMHEELRHIAVNPLIAFHEELCQGAAKPRTALLEASHLVDVHSRMVLPEKLRHVAVNPRPALPEELRHRAANSRPALPEELRYVAANSRLGLPEELCHVAANSHISAYEERQHDAANSRVSVNHSISRVPSRDWSHVAQGIGSVNDYAVQIQSLLEYPKYLELPQYLIDPCFRRDDPLTYIAETLEKLCEKLEDISQAISQLTLNADSSTQTQNQSTFTTIDIPVIKDEQPHTIASRLLHEISQGELEVFLEDISSEQMLPLIHKPNILVAKLTEIKAEIKKECQGAIRKLGDLQTKILIKIFEEVSVDSNQPVRWSPSRWFGDESISGVDRAKWSKALQKLKERGLVEQQFENKLKLSELNKGNSISYISLTSLGVKAAKWLISSALSNTTG
jgi:hypothetical protein